MFWRCLFLSFGGTFLMVGFFFCFHCGWFHMFLQVYFALCRFGSFFIQELEIL